MRLVELFEDILYETSTAGSTSSGNVATVAFPLGSAGFSNEYWRSIYNHRKNYDKRNENEKNKQKNSKTNGLLIKRF